jgi:hypothetical protein
VSVPSADLTEVLLRLPDRRVFLASVYVERANATALDKTVLLLDGTIRTTRQRGGPRLDVVVAGDFNRHGQLYGGGEVLTSRQSDANTIIDFMDRWPLDNLLPYGTETWQNTAHATTIDLMLASHIRHPQVQDPRHEAGARSLRD